jgi:hypothetical protein
MFSYMTIDNVSDEIIILVHIQAGGTLSLKDFHDF